MVATMGPRSDSRPAAGRSTCCGTAPTPSSRRWPGWPSGSRWAEGEVLAREGRIGREFFLILSGSVAVTQKGRRVNTLGPGDFFGELAAMDPGPRNATVTALTDLDVLIIGPRELSAMSDIPGFRGALFRSMARRLRTLEARLAAAARRAGS